jgi:hypothetical protein
VVGKLKHRCGEGVGTKIKNAIAAKRRKRRRLTADEVAGVPGSTCASPIRKLYELEASRVVADAPSAQRLLPLGQAGQSMSGAHTRRSVPVR